MQNKPADRLPPLDLLASFEAAARLLSFTRAAGERFVTQSAMSRQMRALEDELGVALFTRQHRALTLTPDGQRLLAACTAALGTLRGAVRDIRAPNRREVLSLTTTPGFDLAIRYAKVGSAHGVPLFEESMLPVCSPRLVAELALPLREPADLAHHTLLHIAMDNDGSGLPVEWEAWFSGWGLADLQPAAQLSFTSYAEAIAAAVAGQGVALGRRPLVDALLASGQLVAPFEGQLASPRAYQLIIDPAARSRPAVRALEQWLLAEAAKTRPAYTG